VNLLPKRTPGATLTDNPDDDYAQACRDRDGAEGAAMYWEGEANKANRELDRIAKQRDDLILERDGLQAKLDERPAPTPPSPPVWTRLAPAPPDKPLPQPVKDSWQPPPPVDWQEWERNYDEQHKQTVGGDR
jgi:hypothetical protein